MRLVLTLLAAVLFVALPAPAAAQAFVDAAPAASAAPAAPVPETELAATAPAQQEKVQESVLAAARSAENARDDRDQLGPRGGFWWMVGVVVVAGLILVLLLD